MEYIKENLRVRMRWFFFIVLFLIMGVVELLVSFSLFNDVDGLSEEKMVFILE